MRRVALLLIAVLLAGLGAFAQTEVSVPVKDKRLTLFYALDVDVAAKVDDRELPLIDLQDSHAYNVAGQPDRCRPLGVTIVDANSSIVSGNLRVVYVDCLERTRTWDLDFSVVDNRGSAVRTVGYAASVTSIATTTALSVEAPGDQLKVGDLSEPGVGYYLHGRLLPIGRNGEQGVDPFGFYAGPVPIGTAGVQTATIDGTGAFTNVRQWDLLTFVIGRVEYERVVIARVNANQVIVDSPVTLPAEGVPFSFKHRYFTSNPSDDVVIPVRGWRRAMLDYRVDAIVATGGITHTFDCSPQAQEESGRRSWFTLSTLNVPSGSTLAPSFVSVDLDATQYAYCRLGLSVTADDADAGASDSVTAHLTLTK